MNERVIYAYELSDWWIIWTWKSSARFYFNRNACTNLQNQWCIRRSIHNTYFQAMSVTLRMPEYGIMPVHLYELFRASWFIYHSLFHSARTHRLITIYRPFVSKPFVLSSISKIGLLIYRDCHEVIINPRSILVDPENPSTMDPSGGNNNGANVGKTITTPLSLSVSRVSR